MDYDFYASNAAGKSYFAGKVGIGTTNPGAALEVAGTGQNYRRLTRNG